MLCRLLRRNRPGRRKTIISRKIINVYIRKDEREVGEREGVEVRERGWTEGGRMGRERENERDYLLPIN